jgi:3-hydroxybutyryl-CoA dehydrogenase
VALGAIAVVGSGTMGNGIAQVFAQRGHSVILRDLDQAILDRARKQMEKNLSRLIEKETISNADKSSTLARIRCVTELRELAAADFVIEAVVEDVEVKTQLFSQLDEVCKPETILASNTSSISITRLGSATRRPEKVIGMHFMNPVPVMPLVEVIRGQATTDQTLRTVVQLARALGKTPVEVNDYPGFVSNRVLMPMINEAIFCVMEGVAAPEAIDTVMKLGMNHPMGPLMLADLIGLDTCLAILEVLHKGLGDDKYRPCPLLRRMVAAGQLGRKSGRGFYKY